MIGGLIAALALAYGTVLALAYVFQPHLVYFPARELVADPSAIGIRYEDVSLLTEDGLRLHGWFVPARKPRAVLLFLHGNAGNISHRLDSLRIFHDLEVDVLIFDYRGYGRSEGRPSEEGTYRDAVAAWRYLVEKRGVAPERIVLFGRSIGAAIAAALAVDRQPGALILESGFTSIPDLAAELYPWLPARRLARVRYDTRSRLPRVTAPVLIVHSRDDEIIAFTHAQALYAAAREPKSMLELRGTHNSGFLESGLSYVEGLGAFLRKHAARQPG